MCVPLEKQIDKEAKKNSREKEEEKRERFRAEYIRKKPRSCNEKKKENRPYI